MHPYVTYDTHPPPPPPSHYPPYSPHHPPYDSTAPPLPLPHPNAIAAANSAVPLRSTTGRYKTQICRHFILGRCDYGDKCSFAHDAVEVERLINGSYVPPPTNNYNTTSAGSTGHSNQVARTPCKYFLVGHCKLGNRCTYLHTNNTNEETSGYTHHPPPSHLHPPSTMPTSSPSIIPIIVPSSAHIPLTNTPLHSYNELQQLLSTASIPADSTKDESYSILIMSEKDLVTVPFVESGLIVLHKSEYSTSSPSTSNLLFKLNSNSRGTAEIIATSREERESPYNTCIRAASQVGWKESQLRTITYAYTIHVTVNSLHSIVHYYYHYYFIQFTSYSDYISLKQSASHPLISIPIDYQENHNEYNQYDNQSFISSSLLTLLSPLSLLYHPFFAHIPLISILYRFNLLTHTQINNILNLINLTDGLFPILFDSSSSSNSEIMVPVPPFIYKQENIINATQVEHNLFYNQFISINRHLLQHKLDIPGSAFKMIPLYVSALIYYRDEISYNSNNKLNTSKSNKSRILLLLNKDNGGQLFFPTGTPRNTESLVQSLNRMFMNELKLDDDLIHLLNINSSHYRMVSYSTDNQNSNNNDTDNNDNHYNSNTGTAHHYYAIRIKSLTDYENIKNSIHITTSADNSSTTLDCIDLALDWDSLNLADLDSQNHSNSKFFNFINFFNPMGIFYDPLRFRHIDLLILLYLNRIINMDEMREISRNSFIDLQAIDLSKISVLQE